MVTVGKYTDNNQNTLEYSVLMPAEHSKALVQIVTSSDMPCKNYETLANTLTDAGIAVFFCVFLLINFCFIIVFLFHD